MKAWSSRRGVVLTLCAAALSVLFFVLYVCSFTPIQSTFSQVIISTQPVFGERRRDEQLKKLKVYVYDLPRKFNFGLFNRSGSDQEVPWRNLEDLPSPHRFGLKRQHSVEYWLTVDLLGRRGDEADDHDKVAVRVMDPEQADVFFVPFFASLSFNVFGVSMRDPQTEHDRNLQVELLDFLRNSPWWQRSKGRDHILVLHHPNAFRFLKDQLNASVLVVSDFGRFPPTVARLEKDIVAPYSHMVPTFHTDNAEDPFEERTTLLFFQGRIKRKADGVVRTELASILENHPKVHFEEGIATNRTVQEAMEGMRSSKFCLHPAGDTPSSCRLFDAIVSHCVPVIVSDKIELPYEDELDYTSFCLFVSSTEATTPGYLIDLLETFPKDKWLAMWKRLKQVSGHFEYQHPSKKDDAVNMIWKQVVKKLPAINLALHRNKRLKIQDWWNCKRKR